MHHQESTHHAEGLVAHARVAQEDDDESVGLGVAGRRRLPNPSPLVAVLHSHDRQQGQRNNQHAHSPYHVEVQQPLAQAVQLHNKYNSPRLVLAKADSFLLNNTLAHLQDRLQIDHEWLERIQQCADVRRELQIEHG